MVVVRGFHYLESFLPFPSGWSISIEKSAASLSGASLYVTSCFSLAAFMWGTIPSMGNVAQPPLGKATGERRWQAGPTSMDRFSSGKSGLHLSLIHISEPTRPSP